MTQESQLPLDNHVPEQQPDISEAEFQRHLADAREALAEASLTPDTKITNPIGKEYIEVGVSGLAKARKALHDSRSRPDQDT